MIFTPTWKKEGCLNLSKLQPGLYAAFDSRREESTFAFNLDVNKFGKERKLWALRPQKPLRLIRDGEVGGSGIIYILVTLSPPE